MRWIKAPVFWLALKGRALAQLFVAVIAFLAAPITFRELMLFSGTALIGVGLGSVYLPAGLVAAGLILAGVAIFGVR